jgi:hypothetical protein
MKTMTHLILPCLLAIGVTGCVSTRNYLVNRGRDATDIITITGGLGAGAKARIGPLSAGLIANVDWIGLRGGSVFINKPDRGPEYVFGMYDFNCTLIGEEYCGDRWKNIPSLRGKSYRAKTLGGISLLETPSGDHPRANTIPYYTQIELAAGLLGTARLGLNPGELLDFVLGWTTLDIFSDDIEHK